MPVPVRQTIACAAMMLIAVPAFGAPSSSDARFARVAAQGGLAEVQTARIALAKSSNATVRGFAKHMLRDHVPNNMKLAAIMKSEGLMIPMAPDPNSRMMAARLQSLSGRAFDLAYMNGQVRAHGQMQILMQSEATGGTDRALRSYARTTLSTVNEHLAIARGDVAMLRNGRGNGMMNGGSMGSTGGMQGGGSMNNPSSGSMRSGDPGNNGASSGGSMTSPSPMTPGPVGGPNSLGAPSPQPTTHPM